MTLFSLASDHRARSRARVGYRRGLMAAVGAAALVLAIAPAPGALGDPSEPHVSIESPANEAVLNTSTPLFTGITEKPWSEELGGVLEQLTVVIKNGSGFEKQLPATNEGGAWSALATPLPDGRYTAQAMQTTPSPPNTSIAHSQAIAFTIDTVAPSVTIGTPPNGSSSISAPPMLSGSAGTSAGDLPSITVRLFAGAAIGSQPAFETLVARASGGGWSAAPGALAPGTFTAQAEQRDQAGNAGVSQAITFVVTAPPAPPPPAASFKWFPASPRVGQSVSLVSSSTDSSSPITGFAWSLSSTAPFIAGKPVLATTFATPGSHVVRLQVTDAEGRSSIATESVPVSPSPLTLMQPFPIVRFAGSVTSYGAKLRLLTVQAPLGARVQVTCVGRRCKAKPESRIAASSSKSKPVSGAVTLSFARFERALRAGVTLQIRVTMSGQIGKFTSFAVRRGKVPLRRDECVVTSISKPFPCPGSQA
jgi:PKD domain